MQNQEISAPGISEKNLAMMVPSHLRVEVTPPFSSISTTERVIAKTFLTTSDERLKDLISEVDGRDALSYVMGLEPMEYSMGNVQQAGFARNTLNSDANVNAIRPIGENGLVVDQTAVLAYLVAAVKELNSRVI